MHTDRELAKQVVAEIVRQSPGDELAGKVKLFKAFYFAHLYYARDTVGYLTEWPIVKMPNGPGIDGFALLIDELVQDGIVETEGTRIGPYNATLYRATGRQSKSPLPEDAVKAIRKAVEFVSDKTGAQLSDITHEFSRSWNDVEEGQPLSIYLDLLSDEDYDNAMERASRVSKELEAAWNE